MAAPQANAGFADLLADGTLKLRSDSFDDAAYIGLRGPNLQQLSRDAFGYGIASTEEPIDADLEDNTSKEAVVYLAAKSKNIEAELKLQGDLVSKLEGERDTLRKTLQRQNEQIELWRKGFTDSLKKDISETMSLEEQRSGEMLRSFLLSRGLEEGMVARLLPLLELEEEQAEVA